MNFFDADSHTFEFMPYVKDIVRELGGDQHVRTFEKIFEDRRISRYFERDMLLKNRVFCGPWWTVPASDQRCLASALSPSTMRESLLEYGVSVVQCMPTFGSVCLFIPQKEVRTLFVRAFNTYYARIFGDLDGMVPVGIVPMHEPSEATTELAYCVREFGYRSFVLPVYVARPMGEEATAPVWLDTFGVDTTYNYDEVWRLAEALDVSLGFHTTGIGVGLRSSISSYVFNRIGGFADTNAAAAKSAILSGTLKRFPSLRFGFFEGGVAWAQTLFRDLTFFFEQRNKKTIENLNPCRLDKESMKKVIRSDDILCRLYSGSFNFDYLNMMTERIDGNEFVDEWSASGIGSTDDLRQVFENNFFISCDLGEFEHSNSCYNRDAVHASLNLMFGSDFAHWDGIENLSSLRVRGDAGEDFSVEEARFFQKNFERYCHIH